MRYPHSVTGVSAAVSNLLRAETYGESLLTKPSMDFTTIYVISLSDFSMMVIVRALVEKERRESGADNCVDI